jgi:hypothetical protein
LHFSLILGAKTLIGFDRQLARKESESYVRRLALFDAALNKGSGDPVLMTCGREQASLSHVDTDTAVRYINRPLDGPRPRTERDRNENGAANVY